MDENGGMKGNGCYRHGFNDQPILSEISSYMQ